MSALWTYNTQQKERKNSMRNRRFRFPPQRPHHPVRPPLWRSLCTHALDSGLGHDAPSLTQWVSSVWSHLQSLDSEAFVSALCAQPCTALALRSLIAFVDDQLQSLEPTPRIHLTLQQDHALSLWLSSGVGFSVSVPSTLSWRSCVFGLDWQLLSDVRIPQVLGQIGHRRPATEWLQSLSEPYDVVAQIQQQQLRDASLTISWHSIPKAVTRYTIVLVYLFSGRRREGDFMEHAQQLSHDFGLTVSVLLIDLALSDQHDMMNTERVERLLRKLRSQEIAAVLAAPPCETWSRARGRIIDPDAPGPRILRDFHSPWCKSGLTKPELEQLRVANGLMYTTLLVALTCLMAGVRFVVEHPAAPVEAQLATIWRTWPIKLLLQHHAVVLHTIWQSDFGAKFRKPTTLMTIWLADFAAGLRVWMEPVEAQDLRPLAGRDSEGYTTRFAKEYPPALNRSLAHALLADVQRSQGHVQPSSEISDDLSSFIDALNSAQQPREEQRMQPDYATKHRT